MKKMFFMMLAFMLTMSMSMFLFIIYQTPAKRSGFVMLGKRWDQYSVLSSF